MLHRFLTGDFEMAVTEFGSTSAQTVQIWSKLMMREAIYKTYFRKFMGKGPDAIIQMLTDLEKNRGDRISYDLLVQMSQYGVTGDNPIKGYEEALTYYQDDLYIDQRRIAHAFRTMSQQRTVHELRKDAKANLSDRYATILDEMCFAMLAGTAGNNTALAAALPHAGNALVAPDANHLLNNSTDTFRTDHIEVLNEMAVTMEPLIRPSNVEGEPIFIMVIHPWCLTDVRINADTTDWKDMVASAGARGASNPLFSGAQFKWANVICHVSPRIPISGTTPNRIAHNLFLGAQSGVLAFGNAYSRLRQGTMGSDNLFSWFEDTDDYGNEMGVAAGSIYGVKQCIFNSERFGMIVARNLAEPHN
jgi:N4-gp56 family major capsid protein